MATSVDADGPTTYTAASRFDRAGGTNGQSTSRTSPSSWRRRPYGPGVYSLNAPVPGSVQRLGGDLRGELLGFDTIRERPTLVVKRFGDLDPAEYADVEERARRVLAGTPVCEARIPGIDVFERPPTDPAPVVYLAVESPGLRAIHERLVAEFGSAGDIEGEGYTPHVTLARGGDWETARQLTDRDIEPVRWTVTSLSFWDGRFGERISSISLPA